MKNCFLIDKIYSSYFGKAINRKKININIRRKVIKQIFEVVKNEINDVEAKIPILDTITEEKLLNEIRNGDLAELNYNNFITPKTQIEIVKRDLFTLTLINSPTLKLMKYINHLKKINKLSKDDVEYLNDCGPAECPYGNTNKCKICKNRLKMNRRKRKCSILDYEEIDYL